MIKFGNDSAVSAALVEAIKNGDDKAQAAAWDNFRGSIVETMKQDFEDFKASNDVAILAQRGYRQLTSKETAFYEKLAEAAKSKNPKQMFATIIGSDEEEDIMPSTIIEDVYKDLVEEHPLLGAVNFQYVKYLTKWILNDNTKQKAAWGALTDTIVTEITSAFKVVKVDQFKLSAFALIENGMLDLGPVFLDAYIRACLKEALANGLEDALTNGTGIEQPIGLIRDLTNFDVSTGYAAKAATAVTNFTPETYGALVATLAETEEGRPRKITRLCLAVNQQEYLKKIMPATTVLTGAGVYVRDIFPVPTEVIIDNYVADNKAILFLANEYYLFAGGSKDGIIEYDDSVKFLEDKRAFRIKQYANGRPFDNTCATYLDITNLDPAYITVKNVTEVQ